MVYEKNILLISKVNQHPQDNRCITTDSWIHCRGVGEGGGEGEGELGAYMNIQSARGLHLSYDHSTLVNNNCMSPENQPGQDNPDINKKAWLRYS